VAERVTVHHLTPTRRLPLIEEQGLRTRGELSRVLGELEGIDTTASGRYSHGKRISGWLSEAHARAVAAEHGKGLVSWTVDPRKAVAAPASTRTDGDASDYWQAARPLRDWLADGDVPEDLEVHVDRQVRAKHLRIHAPLLSAEDLGDYAGLVAEVADEDRLSAKALMHLAIIASDGDFATPAFDAACALAWRDTPDPDDLIDELLTTDPDKVASAALAMYGAESPDAVEVLRTTLDETRTWAEQNGVEPGEGLLARTSLVLDGLEDQV
jgi:hypothetical protein